MHDTSGSLLWCQRSCGAFTEDASIS